MAETREDSSFEGFIQSDLFTFYVGEAKTAFIVHSKAIAATSGHFSAMVNGDMMEAKTRSAEIFDIERSDFARFLEYAYRKDYTVPSWVLEETTPEIDTGDPQGDQSPIELPPPPAPADEGIPETPQMDDEPTMEAPQMDVPPSPPTPVFSARKWDWKPRKKCDKAALRTTFQEHNYISSTSDVSEAFLPKANSAPNQDFKPVFLAHARLYTFAEMRLIYPLKNLALHKLHKTLMDFQLYNQRVGDVVELARYAYDHGAGRSKDGTLDALRQLVVEYIACEVDTVGKHVEFMRLVEDGGEFVSDFWRIVTKYLL
ncbi:Nn.00g036720.m01.CDS01 [Neocucurbitaria sp. VM-36]